MHLPFENNEKGAILITAVWALLILSVIALGFAYRMSLEIGLIESREENLRARWLAKSGIWAAVSELARDESHDHDALNESWFSNPGAFQNRVLEGGMFTVASRDSTEEGPDRYGMTDETGKININSATEEMLQRAFEGNPEVIPAILDWRDADNVTRSGGAEDLYYRSLESPYDCKDSDFTTLAELHLVRGMTPDMVEAAGEVFTAHGDGRVNINTCPEEVLECLGLADKVVDAILLIRNGADCTDGTDDDFVFTRVEDIRPALMGLGDIGEGEAVNLEELIASGLVSVRSTCFRVKSIGVTSETGARREISAVLERPGEGPPRVVFWYES